jgi:lipopolysaccharide export system protein LptA
MRWQKIARIIVAAVGIGTAGAVYFSTRERTQQEPKPEIAGADPAATMQSGQGKDLRYRGDELLGTLTYESVKFFENNRVVWEKFDYRLPDGTRLSANQAEAQGDSMGGGKPDEITFRDRVRFRTEDGTELRGDSGTYSEVTGVGDMPGRVAFTRGSMSGVGEGGTYERETGTFRLMKDAKVKIASEQEGEESLQASAEKMTYTPDVKAMLFENGARLERSADTLTGDRATLYLSEDEQRLRLIELRGSAEVMPVKGQSSALPEMRANDIDLAFYEGSQALQQARLSGGSTMHQTTSAGRRSIEADRIEFLTAPDGTTLTKLDAAPRDSKGRVIVRLPAAPGAPARVITGATLAATGDEKRGLTNAVFQGGVEFEESGAGGQATPGARRVAKSRTLRLVVKGQLDAIEEAHFDQAVEVTDADMRGFGDVGVYRAGSGEMDLRPNRQTPGKRAAVTNGDAGMTVEAVELITAYLNTGSLYARGNVTTATAGSKTAKPASQNSIFNSRDPIYGSAVEFRYDDATKVATYIGSASSLARVQQLQSAVHAEHIEYFQERQDLVAKGRVDSTFDIAPRAADGKSQKAAGNYRAKAEALVYTEKTRTAKYTGGASLENADGTTTAEAMDLVLAKESRSLDRLEATGRVHSVLQKGDREARGDRLVYQAQADLYQLWGKPLTLVNRETDGTCYAQEGTMARFEGELGAPDFPADQNAAGGAPRRSIPCPTLTAPAK